jgi:hypothetical protein
LANSSRGTTALPIGTVKAVDWSGVQIAWANDKEQFFHHNNMGEINPAKSPM